MDPGFEARLFAGVTVWGGVSVIPASSGIHIYNVNNPQIPADKINEAAQGREPLVREPP